MSKFLYILRLYLSSLYLNFHVFSKYHLNNLKINEYTICSYALVLVSFSYSIFPWNILHTTQYEIINAADQLGYEITSY